MDPDATLYRMRELINNGQINNEEFVDLFIHLDAWVSSGGFLPSSWAHGVATLMCKELCSDG